MAHRNTATRDTDWFTATIPASGVLTFGGDAEFETYLFEIGPPDCGSAGTGGRRRPPAPPQK